MRFGHLIGALVAVSVHASPAQSYTESECDQIRRDSMELMRHFHIRALDGRPGYTSDQLRPHLRSRLLREDDGLFWFVAEIVTTNHVEAFRQMGERDRELNRAHIGTQIRTRCLNGVMRRYAHNP